MLPPTCYLYLQDQVSQKVFLYTTGIAVFAGAMLYSMSYFFRRIIGLIYLNESGRTVKVAHLTFWGRRNDIYCPIETVVTLDEAGDSKGELLLQFKRSKLTPYTALLAVISLEAMANKLTLAKQNVECSFPVSSLHVLKPLSHWSSRCR
ncbi:transmembrane protein 186 [Egretta garzetta]|uniref:transmembrane protein 186 n=1 Tax=Egretta garzetta TaxID=188379 RepID=UPI00163BC729|nr:transmembrane protein 186 [Egretta garzetta]